MTRHILRNSTLALLFLALTAASSSSFTHFTHMATAVSQSANNSNDPGGGDPEPINPGGGLTIGLHLS